MAPSGRINQQHAGGKERRTRMPDVMMERRKATRYPLALTAEVTEIATGAKLLAHTSELSRTGCYTETLNPFTVASQIQIRISHGTEVFETLGRVPYISPGRGMGIAFRSVVPEQQAILDRWLADAERQLTSA
jgi:hypothetical protein